MIKKYIVLENAPYRELADFIIYTKSGLGEFKSKAFFYKIVKAIQSIHQKGICHRDIKMENILLTEDFSPKIGDFGAALDNSNIEEIEKSKSQKCFGTDGFISPKKLNTNDYDLFKADIFSLGAILFYLAFG